MEEKKYIHAGEIFVTTAQCEIATVLGSCVAVCLFDPYARVSGMNHYLLPLWNGNGLKTPRFGNISIPLLVEKMVELGAKPTKMQAKIFGGASIHSNTTETLMVGKKNIIIAKEMLSELRIPIMAEDVGGTKGRRIMMQTQSGKVLMKYTQGTTL